MVKQNLEQAITSVEPVRIRLLSNPETAYANPGGGPFLLSIGTTETKIEQRITRTEAQLKELTIFFLLYHAAVGIPDRFLARFLQRVVLTNIGNPSAIKVGNEEAHNGDVVTDVCLLRNGLIAYTDTFRWLYVIHWEEAKSLLSMFIDFSVPSWASAIADRRY